MIPNDNIKVVRQHQMVVTLIGLRQMKKLKETKSNDQLIRTVNCSCSKMLVIIKTINKLKNSILDIVRVGNANRGRQLCSNSLLGTLPPKLDFSRTPVMVILINIIAIMIIIILLLIIIRICIVKLGHFRNMFMAFLQQ